MSANAPDVSGSSTGRKRRPGRKDILRREGQPLRSARHEAFCQARARGETADAAYRLVGYKPCRGHASRLAANGIIEARIAEIQTEAGRLCNLSKAEAMAFLAECVMTPVGEVDENNRLAQEVTYIESENGSSKKIKMPGKNEALRLLGQWCGWEKGTEAENRMADSLGAAMARARAR